MTPHIRAALKVAGLSVLTLTLLPSHLILLAFRKGGICPYLWHLGASRLIGLKITVEGEPLSGQPVVFVGNHLSYLDIPLLGALLPDACFIAKTDVRGWPVFGVLAVLQRTVFVSRNPRDAKKVDAVLHAALSRGDSLILFPEGTSSAGETVLPFKSSAFSPLVSENHRHRPVQPFTIALKSVDGVPATTTETRDKYAYYKDHVLAPHLWGFFGLRGAEVRVTFHPPEEDIAAKMDRKLLAQKTFDAVLSGLDFRKT